MSQLAVTLIDVGWGDSVFIESTLDSGKKRYALIDCNDTNVSRSAYLFVKKHLEKQQVKLKPKGHLFDFTLLTHAHDDHICGLKQMMGHFGTDWYWYPKSDTNPAFAALLRYANRAKRVKRHQAIDRTKNLGRLGAAEMKVLWPPYQPGPQPYDAHNPNRNSVVLLLTLGDVRFVLTGDCEAECWNSIQDPEVQDHVEMFKFPHHGAENGLFDDSDGTPWLDILPQTTKLGMSLHVRHGHPHQRVIAELESRGFDMFRTDEHYHLTFTTDGTRVSTKWSRI